MRKGLGFLSLIEVSEDIRMIVMPDEDYDIEELKGDTYNPEVNTDIDPAQLKEEEEAFEARVAKEGCTGIIGQYKCPCCGEWKDADSVWGYVGTDWRGSGCEEDVINSAKYALTSYIP